MAKMVAEYGYGIGDRRPVAGEEESLAGIKVVVGEFKETRGKVDYFVVTIDDDGFTGVTKDVLDEAIRISGNPNSTGLTAHKLVPAVVARMTEEQRVRYEEESAEQFAEVMNRYY